MLHFASNGPGNSALVPRRSDSLNATQTRAGNSHYTQQQHQLLLTIEQELHDARRVGTHGQEEDLRSALSMVIGRVVEMSTLLQEAYKSKAELEVQLNVAKSNLQLVIANNEMLEEALRSGGGNGRDVGWRRSSGTGARQQQSAQHENNGDHSPNSSPTDSQGNSGVASSSNTRPGTPTISASDPTRPRTLDVAQLAIAASRWTYRRGGGTQIKLGSTLSEREQRRRKIRGEKTALEAELESLSQALFEEANNMVASERKARAEAEGRLAKLGREVQSVREIGEELKEVRQEKEALRSALKIIEGENESLRSASRMSSHGSNAGSVDLDRDGSPPRRITRSRSSSEVGTKSPVRLSPNGSPHVASFSPSSEAAFSHSDDHIEDAEPIVFAPTGLKAPDTSPDDGGTPRRPVLPLDTHLVQDDDVEYEYDYEHVSRTNNSSPSPPPTATMPSVVDPWRM
ncbi:hypothetical protein C8F01DRAFT_1233703 [Mycena amicta]|nr:hypothetical protein C8F01DRAFT_1233703 [Mycena amicta]